MSKPKIDIKLEGVLTIKRDGELIALVHNDENKRSQVFSTCKDAGVEEIKSLLELLLTNGSLPKAE